MTGVARPTTKGRKLKNDNNVALGDILTLIFGFFVLMVTLNRFAIVQDSGQGTPASAKTSESRMIRKPVSSECSNQGRVLTISEKDFLNMALGNKPLIIPDSVRTTGQSITVEACVSKRGVQRDDQRLWERSAARAEKVGMILTSLGIAPNRIAVRALGGYCEHIESVGKEKQSVAIRW
jgi:hypothetical protein